MRPVLLTTPSSILAAVEGVPDWIGELAFGSVVVLALFGWIWFRPAVDSLQGRMEKAETQRDALVETYQDEVIPTLREANVAAAKTVALMEELLPLLRRIDVLLSQQQDRTG